MMAVKYIDPYAAKSIWVNGVGEPFPGADYWANTSREMASRFKGATPALIWVVGIMQFSGRGRQR
jgi:hypothetical protein